MNNFPEGKNFPIYCSDWVQDFNISRTKKIDHILCLQRSILYLEGELDLFVNRIYSITLQK
ncbi:MAG TPA: hypothetical protein DDY68_01000 [Porphyromonadaceae bacterium]|nr:hypothetical protein [Porphyromonadaceae bacterium]